ncbi:MAG: hypothetical protein HOE69_00285 [Euryarchaeota archaeon]|jgi:hypothetical protein|nr:hypothetical protein [Euryarchaeota archaeon]
MRTLSALLLASIILITSFSGCLFSEDDVKEEPLPELRMNHVQAKGSHNSYHMRPLGSDYLSNYNYTHAPLAEQAEQFGVRQFELDVWYIPGVGLRVYHNLYDSRTTCVAFTDCLNDLKNWSDENPSHIPLWILIEPKDLDWIVDGIDLFAEIESDIDSVWPQERRVEPDDVRGERATLRRAVTENGWPLLDDVRGKAAFALIDKDGIRDAYLERHDGLINATMFAIVDQEHPAAALISWTQPISKQDVLKNAVESGFIVRTRPDSDTVEAEEGNYTRFEAALTSGAHMISTDFPGNDETIDYAIWIPDGPVRCNPLIAPMGCTSALLESL